ncbi:MAG: winged helix DNA-binding domain-containing protein [Chloroflexota bacterium]
MAKKAIQRRVARPPAAHLTWEQALAWRLGRHHLNKRAPREAAFEVVADIGGLQAQVLSYTELMLLARVEGIEAGFVEQALWEERSLVKTWAMRGTLHLLPSREYPLWQAALNTFQHYLRPFWLDYFGFTREGLEQAMAAVAQVLDGRMLTREELAAEVTALTGSTQIGEVLLYSSWGTTLKPAAYRGHLCFAPNQGQNVRFTRPASWLAHWQETDPDKALPEITRRYLAAYGPATPADYGRWFGLSVAQAKAQFNGLGEDVTLVAVGGRPAWLLTRHVAEIADASPNGSVQLLPGFDPYVLGAARDEPTILDPAFKSRVYRPQGWISPVLLVNGRIAGVWQHNQKPKRVEVQIEPFSVVPEWVRPAAEVEAERLAQFLGKPLALNWQTS